MSGFIPYGRQQISEEDIEAVVRVLRSDHLTQGPAVPAFEQAVARHCGSAHAVAMNSATSALHVACLALGVGPGDRVWTSPVTFVASANCALYCGATVDFVDVDPATGNTKSTIKAAMPVSLPTGFRIVRRAQVGNDVSIPIADKQLNEVVAVFGTNVVAVQRLMRNPDLKQSLLQLFEVCKEPAVEGAWVSATGPGMICGDIESQVDAVLGVAQSLGQAWLPLAAALERARKPVPPAAPPA